MAPSTVRFGIVGCGAVATDHAVAIERTDHAVVLACTDVDEATAQAFAAEHGCDWYEDRRALLAVDALDAVVVCTPNGTHCEVAVDAAEHGRDVLCEKPLDISSARMTRMIDACSAAGVTLGGVLQTRTHSAVRYAKEFIESGELGTVTLADVQMRWTHDPDYYSESWHGIPSHYGNVLVSQGTHFIDILQWLVGDIDRVTGLATTQVQDIDMIDTAAIAVAFSHGALGAIELTDTIRPARGATLAINGTDASVSMRIGAHLTLETEDGWKEVFGADGFDGGHEPVIADFVDAVRTDRDPAVTGADARQPIDVGLAALQASEEQRHVTVDAVRTRS